MRDFLKIGVPALSLAAVSGQAHALSCMQPDIERSFNAWVDSENTYYIGVGSLMATEPLPKIEPYHGHGDREPIPSVLYQFSGYLLAPDRRVPMEMPITVEVGCIASWCGGFPRDGETKLMALEGTDVNDLTLTISACPGTRFPAAVETKVAECFRAGRCPGR